MTSGHVIETDFSGFVVAAAGSFVIPFVYSSFAELYVYVNIFSNTDTVYASRGWRPFYL